MKNLSLLVVCVSFLGSIAFAQSAPPIACAKIVTIALFGDSTMHGADATYVGPESARVTPALLMQKLMDRTYGAGRVKVLDRSMSGTNVKDLLDGKDKLNSAWPKPLEELQPQIILVNHAINSTKVGVDRYESQLQKLVDLSRGKVQRFIFQTPNPLGALAQRWNQQALPLYADGMRAVASKNGLPLIDVHAFILKQPHYDTDLVVDAGLHPNQTLYKMLMSQLVGPAMVQEVNKLICKR